LELKPVDGSFIYVSGVLRDFIPTTHPDFGVDQTNADDTIGWIEDSLDLNGKPIVKTGSSPSSVTKFGEWFNTINGVNKATTFSTRLLQTGPAANGDEEDRYRFLSEVFIPRPLEAFGVNPAGYPREGTDNTFFTWEIHTYVKYNATANAPLPLTMSSSDDMWVFINGKLACDLGGIHPLKNCTIDLNNLVVSHSLTQTDSDIYRCDIYYAHRNSKRDAPGIMIELPKVELCDALSSGIGITEFDFDFIGTTTANVPNTKLAARGSASSTATPDGVVLISQTSSQSALYASGPSSLLQVKVLQGFRSTFSFKVGTGTAVESRPKPISEGFAFVIQSAGPNAEGFSSYHLGYGGLPAVDKYLSK
jgi:fibro-slime domain-containing protein